MIDEIYDDSRDGVKWFQVSRMCNEYILRGGQLTCVMISDV